MKIKMSIGKRTYIMISAITIIITIVAGLFSFYTYSDFIKKQYTDNASKLAMTAAAVIDKEALKEWEDILLERYNSIPASERVSSDMWDTPEHDEYLSKFKDIYSNTTYKNLLTSMQSVFDINECSSLYVFYLDKDNKYLLYVVDASYEPTSIGEIDPLFEVNYKLLDDPSVGFPAYITNTKAYGYLVTAGSPIVMKDGSIIGYAMVDIPMNDIMNARLKFLVTLIFILFAISIVLVLLFLKAVKNTIVAPINKLATAANDYISSENKESENIFGSVKINTGDELEALSGAMAGMENDIKNYIINLTTVTAEKEKISAELSVAAQIQESVLPRIFPPFPNRHEFDIYATMTPAKEVGGDFYDFFLIDEDHLGIVMADVSGKGVPASLFMMISKTLIKNQSQFTMSPGKILEAVNNQLCENNEAEMFVTVWLGILTISTGHVVYANAGHEFPAIYRAGGNFELIKERHGFVLGGMEDMHYKESELTLGFNDCLFVYTDGVPEATNASNELFGTDRMIDALNIQPSAEPDILLSNTRRAVDEFVQDAPQFDDLTMLAIRYLLKVD